MSTMRETLQYLAEALRVRRYHTEVVLHQQTIGEHTSGVALLCLLLTEGAASPLLVRAALCHDLGERRWGDMPGHVKAELKLDERFNRLERGTLRELGLEFDLEFLSEGDHRVLRLADKLDLLLHCCVERAQGNQLVRSIWDKVCTYVHEFKPLNSREADVLISIKLIWRDYDK